MNAPDWLTKRDGTLKPGSVGAIWYVLLGGRPNYSLVATPALGKFSCVIRQTINGAQVAGEGTYLTADDALRGGLEELRKALGWG